jgi:gas vesicle protein
MKTFLFCCSILMLSIADSFGQCDTTNANFDAVVKKYEQKYKEMAPDTSQKDAPWSNSVLASLNLDIDFSMVEKKLSFDLVSVTMKNKKMSFSVPKTTVKEKKMSFTIYEPGMKKVVIGWKLEFSGLNVKKVPIYGKIPTMVKKTQTVITKIPTFSYSSTGFVTKVPEFKRDRKELIIKLPKVVVTKVSAKAEALRDDAEKLEKKYENLGGEAKKEMAAEVVTTFDCQRNSIASNRDSVQKEFTLALAELDDSIKQMKSAGADPSKVIGEDGIEVNMLKMKDDLSQELTKALASFDEALTQLLTSEEEILNNLSV